MVQLTDVGGNIVRNYIYDAFGVEVGKGGSDRNPFRYCGEYTDLETNTIYLRNRYYTPATGRFSTEDTIRSGLNWYTYCVNNPNSFKDPLGLVPMGLRDLLKETYGSDKGLSWNSKTNTATINGVSFSSSAGNAYINSSGSMIVDTAIFVKAMGFNSISSNALADLSGSYNLVRNITMSKNNKISEPTGVSGRLNKVEKVLYAQYPISFATSYADALIARKKTEALYGNGYSVGDRADAFRHSYWNATSTSNVGANLTRLFTNAHEYGTPDNFKTDKVYLETIMDLNNNAVGRSVGATWGAGDYERILMGIMIENQLQIIFEGNLVPANQGYYWTTP